jgi:hypothetical protein
VHRVHGAHLVSLMRWQALEYDGGVRPSMLIPLLFLALMAGPATVVAQGTKAVQQLEEKGRQKDAAIPKAYLPPPGMCRVWVDNVPAARQPAPTDCATAIRNRPPNARVVFPAGKSAEPKSLAPGRTKGDTTKKKPPN